MSYTSVGKSKLLTYSGSHTHDEWEIVLNLEGEGVSAVGEHTVPFKAGTVLCIPPNTPHTKAAKDGFRDMFIHFPTLALPQDEGALRFEDEDHRLEQLMGMIHAVYHKKEGSYREITEHLAAALERLAVERLDAAPMDPRVSCVADLVVDNFNDPDFSLSDATRKSGYCTDHLRRLFRSAYGVSPLEYLTTLRINYAKKLMRENAILHHTVAEIATLSGFADISYFSRVFKKHTGLSPREYMQGAHSEELKKKP